MERRKYILAAIRAARPEKWKRLLADLKGKISRRLIEEVAYNSDREFSDSVILLIEKHLGHPILAEVYLAQKKTDPLVVIAHNNPKPRKRFYGIVGEQIVGVLRENPDGVSVSEIRDRIDSEEFWPSTPPLLRTQNVRNIVQKLLKAGCVKHHARGVYSLVREPDPAQARTNKTPDGGSGRIEAFFAKMKRDGYTVTSRGKFGDQILFQKGDEKVFVKIDKRN